ncbi:MAG: hypothetical protein ACLR4A_19170 [Christensenellales bacterium]
MEGAAAVALIGAACMALLTFGAWRALKEQPVMVLLCAAMLAMLAVAAHLAMLDIKPGRVSKVLAPMLEEMWNYDLGTAMAWERRRVVGRLPYCDGADFPAGKLFAVVRRQTG